MNRCVSVIRSNQSGICLGQDYVLVFTFLSYDYSCNLNCALKKKDVPDRLLLYTYHTFRIFLILFPPFSDPEFRSWGEGSKIGLK